MLLTFGEYELDTELFELRHNGQPRPVEPQVFDLLVYLAQHRDRIISRQELLDELWTGKVVTESTLSSRIKAVRHAVGDSGQTQNCIATFNRRGYRFVATVEEAKPDAVHKNNNLFPSPPDRPSLAVLPFAHNHGSARPSHGQRRYSARTSASSWPASRALSLYRATPPRITAGVKSASAKSAVSLAPTM